MGFVSGWGERFHDIDISIDGERVALVRYGGDIDFQGRKDFPIATDPVFIRAGEHRVTAAFVRQMDDVLGTCLERGVKGVANAGGLNPAGCRDTLIRIDYIEVVPPPVAGVAAAGWTPSF